MSPETHIDALRPGRDLDWASLQAEWRTLEAAADGSFFQSWTWVGCCVADRYRDPLLLRARSAGAVVGLALFERTGWRLPWGPAARWRPSLHRPKLHLHETGRRDQDSVFVEHNAPLLARGRDDLLRPMLQAALRHGRLVLSGVGDDVLAVARTLGPCRVRASRPAPFAVLPATEAQWLAGRGTATRAHLRRSRRLYEAAGRVVVEPARDVAEGLEFLDRLAVLHQARWTARGRPGAFAEPAFVAFHRALVARGLPRGEVELLRIGAVGPGRDVIGYLYNFRWRDRVHAYQAGFDYAAAGPRQAPGLTCHQAAIGDAIASGARLYDFLAGEARYKSSLGDDEVCMHWLELASDGTPYARLQRVRQRVRAACRAMAARP